MTKTILRPAVVMLLLFISVVVSAQINTPLTTYAYKTTATRRSALEHTKRIEPSGLTFKVATQKSGSGEVITNPVATDFNYIVFCGLEPEILCNGSWRKFVDAADFSTGGHKHYKGYFAANEQDAVYIKLRTPAGPDTRYYYLGPETPNAQLALGTDVYLDEIGETDGGDNKGYKLDLGGKKAELLDIDVWVEEAMWKMRVNTLTGDERKLSFVGTLKGIGWNQNKGIDLVETSANSLQFTGRVEMQSWGTWDKTFECAEEGIFAFFAPCYISDGIEQRFGCERSDADKLTSTGSPKAEIIEGETYTKGFEMFQDLGWHVYVGNNNVDNYRVSLFDVTVDLSQGSLEENKIRLDYPTDVVNVSSVGWATYAPPFNVNPDFASSAIAKDEVQLLYVTGHQNNTAVLAMADAKEVLTGANKMLAKGEGVLLKTDKKATTVTFTYSPEATESLKSNHQNKLIGTTTKISRPDGDDLYILTNKNNHPAFYKWAKSGSNNDLAAKKCYLKLAAPGTQQLAPELYDFGEVETGIQTLPEATDNEQKGAEIYNLSGQRIQRMQRGVNIVNGKKVLF